QAPGETDRVWKLRSERDLGRKYVHAIWNPRGLRDPPHSDGSEALQWIAMPHQGYELAILRHDPVARRIEGHRGADDRRLLAGRRREDAIQALPLQRCGALVVSPRGKHPAQGLDQGRVGHARLRSEEHTSELQSRGHLV